MVRTQIYLDERQKSVLERLSAQRGASVSDLIRHAVDQFIEKTSIDFDKALEVSYGIWRDRSGMDDSSSYVETLRRDWEKRDKRGG